MRKVSEIIRDSALLISAIDSNGSLTPTEQQDCLRSFLDLLDDWSVAGYKVIGYTREEFTMTIGQNEYTIGTGGDFNTDRPASIDSMQVQYPGESIDYPVEIIPQSTYDDRALKTVSGRPYECFVNPGYPLTTLFFYQTPEQAYTVGVNSFSRLTNLAAVDDVNDVVQLPEEYRRAIKYSLADDIADMFGFTAPPNVSRKARETKAVIERINAANLTNRAELDLSLHGNRRRSRRELFNE